MLLYSLYVHAYLMHIESNTSMMWVWGRSEKAWYICNLHPSCCSLSIMFLPCFAGRLIASYMDRWTLNWPMRTQIEALNHLVSHWPILPSNLYMTWLSSDLHSTVIIIVLGRSLISMWPSSVASFYCTDIAHVASCAFRISWLSYCGWVHIDCTCADYAVFAQYMCVVI